MLVFYRGGWCPYCTAHLSQLQKIESQLVNASWQILAISPDCPEKLDEQLDDQSRIYLASPAGLAIDRTKGEARISAIFDWYGGDFSSVEQFVEKHSGQSLNGLKNRYINYDWSLNE